MGNVLQIEYWSTVLEFECPAKQIRCSLGVTQEVEKNLNDRNFTTFPGPRGQAMSTLPPTKMNEPGKNGLLAGR